MSCYEVSGSTLLLGLFGIIYACFFTILAKPKQYETICAVCASAHEVTVLVVWLKKVIILNSKAA